MLYYLSTSLEPSFNLAVEAYLLNNLPSNKGILLLYVNKPSAVCGKNQCIWKEINWNYLFNGGEVYRRISGGGTVYHDFGNLNFSFIVPHNDKLVNNYSFFNSKLVSVLKEKGFPVEVNTRADILLNGKKISGNAQFTNRKNLLSHGTILFSSELEKLSLALKKNEFSVFSRAIPSVRSPVTNLNDFSTAISSIDTLKQLIINFYNLEIEWKPDEKQLEGINALVKTQMLSNEWLWNRNPDFTVKKEKLEFEVINNKLHFKFLDSKLEMLQELDNYIFMPEEIKKGLKKISSTPLQYEFFLKNLIS